MRASLYKRINSNPVACASIDEQPSFGVWIVGLEGYKQQFCQSRSWIELGGEVSLRLSTKVHSVHTEYVLAFKSEGYCLGLNQSWA